MFLALAIEQFREIRRIEFESLQALDDVEYIFRGTAYIDGIAKTFEARNYFAMVVSLITGIAMMLIPYKLVYLNILGGTACGAVVFYIINNFSKGKTVGDIADVKPGEITIKGSDLYVDDIYVTNHLGTDIAKELVHNEGLAAVIYPREEHLRITLDNTGQRQAIIFEACRSLGLKRYHFTRKDYKEGRIAIVFVPITRDENKFIELIKSTPLLETVKKSYKVMKNNPLDK